MLDLKGKVALVMGCGSVAAGCTETTRRPRTLRSAMALVVASPVAFEIVGVRSLRPFYSVGEFAFGKYPVVDRHLERGKSEIVLEAIVSKGVPEVAGVWAEGGTVCVLIRRLNSSRGRSMALK